MTPLFSLFAGGQLAMTNLFGIWKLGFEILLKPLYKEMTKKLNGGVNEEG